MNLTVIEKFLEHEVGEIITDVEKVDTILRSEFAKFVVKVSPKAEPEDPAPIEPVEAKEPEVMVAEPEAVALPVPAEPAAEPAPEPEEGRVGG
jgi:hypothetical protein